MTVTNVLWRVLHWWINLAPNFATYDEPEPFPSRRVADRRPGILYLFQPILWTDVTRVRFTSGYPVTLFMLYHMLPSEGHVSLLSTMPPPPSPLLF